MRVATLNLVIARSISASDFSKRASQAQIPHCQSGLPPEEGYEKRPLRVLVLAQPNNQPSTAPAQYQIFLRRGIRLFAGNPVSQWLVFACQMDIN